MEFDDDLQDEILSMNSLCQNICHVRDQVDGILHELYATFTNIQEKVFEIFQKSTLSHSNDCGGKLNLQAAKNVKLHFDWMGFVRKFIDHCREILDSKSPQVAMKKQDQALNHLLDILGEQIVSIENQVKNVSRLLSGEDVHADLFLLANKLEILCIWASVFENDF